MNQVLTGTLLTLSMLFVSTLSAQQQDWKDDLKRVAQQVCADIGDMNASQIYTFSSHLNDFANRYFNRYGSRDQDHLTNLFTLYLDSQLKRDCPEYQLEGSNALLPNTHLIDKEELLIPQQRTALKEYLTSLSAKKEVDLFVVSTEGPYPSANLRTYGTVKGSAWNIGERQRRGGIMLVISRELNDAAFVELKASTKLVAQEELLRIRNEVLLPAIRAENYFSGLIEALEAIESRL